MRASDAAGGAGAERGWAVGVNLADQFGLAVQRKMCRTCIYKPGSPLDIAKLESDVADGYGGFKGSRTCHHSETAVCAGFWKRHKDKFAAGQIAQRLGLVVRVDHDCLEGSED